MNRRRNYLLTAFLAMIALAGGDRLWVTYYETPMNELGARASQYARQIRKVQQEMKACQQKQQQLHSFEERSLPGDPEVARTVYQRWLNELAERFELDGPRVDSTTPRQQDGYRVLPFSLNATSTVHQLTQVLTEFYRANTIHRIRSLSISPVDQGDRISFSASIEAVLVEGVEQREELPLGMSAELALSDPLEYRSIALRNIFSPTGGTAAMSSTFLTAIVWVNGEAEAWFTCPNPEDNLKFREGDVLEVAGLFARVARISETVIILDSPEGKLKLQLNQPLSEAQPLLDAEQPESPPGNRASIRQDSLLRKACQDDPLQLPRLSLRGILQSCASWPAFLPA